MRETLVRIFWKEKAIAIPLWSALVSFIVLFALVPYSSGYNDLNHRISMYESMIHGYTEVENGEWGFGFIVLPAALVMLWTSRHQFTNLTAKPAVWTGGAILLFSFTLYLAGFKGNQKYIGYVAGQSMIAGMIVWFLGWKYFFRGFWIFVFVGMVWPLIPLIDVISFPLRKIATEVTVFLWNLFGGNAVRTGTAIFSAGSEGVAAGEHYSLQIAAACSGLRSLFALLMLSLIFAAVGVKKTWHRFFIVSMMIPVAIAGNVVRIKLLLAGTILWGNDFAVGSDADPSTYHLGAGFMVYFVALFCMFSLVAILNGGDLKKFLKRKKSVIKKAGS